MFTLSSTNQPLILSSAVLSETLNLLGKKFGHETAVQAGQHFLSGDGQFLLTQTPAQVIRTALEMFNREKQSVSFTDCIVMAIADEYGTRAIFGFDDIFKKRGYLLPGATQEHAA
jgi:predicted nucleic acid-binding protein